jgi:spermidine synthase
LSLEATGADELAARFAAANIDTRYYTPEVHRAAFALPRFMQETVEGATRPEQLAKVSNG